VSDEGSDGRKPFWAKCGDCGHCWQAAYLPMPLADAARLLGRAACPACASTRAMVARQADGVLIEPEVGTPVTAAGEHRA